MLPKDFISMKSVFSLFLLISLSLPSFGQWISVGDGFFGNSISQPNPGTVLDIEVFKGNLYAVGEFDSIGSHPIKNYAMWDGQDWQPLPMTGKAEILRVFDDELIMAGNTGLFLPYIDRKMTKWDGLNWSLLSDSSISSPGNEFPINALIEYRSELLIGGAFFGFGSTESRNFIKYNGSNFVKDSVLSEQNLCNVADLDVENETLILSGPCYNQIPPITRSIYTYLDSLVNTNIDLPGNLIVYAGNVFSGNKLLDLTSGTSTFFPISGSFSGAYKVFNGYLYTVGMTGRNIQYLDSNLNIFPIGDTLPLGSEISAIEIFNDELVICGKFEFPGEPEKTSLVKHGNSLPSSIQEELSSNDFSIYPNPTSGLLFVNSNVILNDVKVFNLLGELVFQKYPFSNEFEFDLSFLGPGIFLVYVSSDSSINTSKIVIR